MQYIIIHKSILVSFCLLSFSMEATLITWGGLSALRTRVAIPVVGVSPTGRFIHAGQGAFLEKPCQQAQRSKGTTTMAHHIIIEVSVYRLARVISLLCF